MTDVSMGRISVYEAVNCSGGTRLSVSTFVNTPDDEFNEKDHYIYILSKS